MSERYFTPFEKCLTAINSTHTQLLIILFSVTSKLRLLWIYVGTYYIPTLTEHADFIAFARSLPVATPPDVFGFHPNADITKHFREAEELLDTAILTQVTATDNVIYITVNYPSFVLENIIAVLQIVET